jgi:hypothetical protein
MTGKNNLILRSVCLISVFLLLIGLTLKQIKYPNQLLFFLAGIALIILVYLPLWGYVNAKNAPSNSNKLQRIISGIAAAILLFLAPIAIMSGNTIQIGIALVLFLIILVTIYQKHKTGNLKQGTSYFLDTLLVMFIVIASVNAPINSQAPDKLYDPIIFNPQYSQNEGPIIYLDEAHTNFHRLDGLYWAFGKLVRTDGYRTQPFKEKFTKESLEGVEILAIANAINEKNANNWSNPTFSAFEKEEIEALRSWVEEGGSLLLIADHMPFSGAAKDLAAAFNVEFINGFAMDTVRKPDFFTQTEGTLNRTILTDISIDSILTFTGQAFRIPADATPILLFGKDYVQWEPETAWQFGGVEPYSVQGYSQLAFMEYEKGKVVFAGEAMMFTSQLRFGLSWMKLGISDPRARNNKQLILNIIHWLDE